MNRSGGPESEETNAARRHDPHETTALPAADVADRETVQYLARARAAVELPTVSEENYDRENEIARGGMGRIVSAWDRRLGRPVAIKELLRGTDELRRRFEGEAVMTARLQHPAIINIYEAGRWPSGEPFYAMKRVEGRSLSDAIQAETSLNRRLSLLPGLIAIAEAMAYAHGQHVIHRDLKPANVLLGSFGESVVIDWGLAKDMSASPDAWDQSPEAATRDGGLTVTGTVMGTPAYMPPEQARGEVVDERADVYALGAILYHLLAGEAPYTGHSSAEVLKQVLASAPRPLEEREPSVAPDLLAIVRKAMAREVTERYRTAKDLAEDLKRFQTGQLVGAHAYTPTQLAQRWIARHRAAVLIAAIASTVMIGAGVVAVRRIASERNEAQAARREAESRNAELILNQARNAVRDDPTSAIAWLKGYPLDGRAWGAARVVAAHARRQGIATKVLLGHEHRVNAVAFSPDGRLLASGANDKTVRLWDIATGTSRVLKGHDWFIYSLAFSPDGRFLASNGSSTLYLWNVASGEGRSFRGVFLSRDIAFSPDSLSLAALGFDEDGLLVLLWDTQTGFTRVIRDPTDKLKRHELKGDQLTLAFSSDGGTLFTHTSDQVLRQWDLKTGVNQRVKARSALASSRDGRLLATAGTDGAVRIKDLQTGHERLLVDRSGSAPSLSFSGDGEWIASASADPMVRLWNLKTGRFRTLPSAGGAGHRVMFSSDGRTLASVTRERTIRLWDVASAEGQELRGHSGEILGAAFSPDGGTVATASADRSIRIWPTRVDDHRVLFAPDAAPGNPGRKIAFSPRGNALAAAWDGDLIHLWDFETGSLRELKSYDKTSAESSHPSINALAFSRDGAALAAASRDRTVRVWNVVTGEGRSFLGHEGAVLGIAFSPDGTRLASAGMDRTARLWNVQGGESRVFTGHDNPVNDVTFSPDGRWLASSSVASRNDNGQKDLDLLLWDVVTGHTRTLPGHRDTTTAVRFSPDGRTLASGSMDTTVRLWDVLSGRVSKVLEGDGSQVFRLNWSLDGRWLASGNEGGTLRIWNLVTGQNRRLAGVEPSFSSDGATLAVSGREGATLWDTLSGEGRALREAYNNVAISPDGTLVAAIGEDGAVHLWKDDLPRDPVALKAWLEKITAHTVGAGSDR